MAALEHSPLFEEIKKLFPTENELDLLKRVEDEILEGFRKGVIVGAQARKDEQAQSGQTLNESMDKTKE